ncbi:fatty acid CoA ligase family protein [Nocardia sp. NBC_00565]|uniref:fatty acid CoA ligase family protein n=1 Tax=Nocardia sp. NBC_00565 TaxID=2975993 RepID=UPI002E80FCA7|nr:fatty acid CoA ligase family protein [Nocardia sp. NBC_00565]WUC07035.1 fatty acid CoA ligase family protein [Nocardia sp. NBC_00565]
MSRDLSALLDRRIEERADLPAISYPTVAHPERAERAADLGFAVLTFAEFGTRVRSYAAAFERIGITKGVKTIVMVKPDPDLFAVIFALFEVGAVPVVVDPGMGVRRMLHCFRSVGAEAFIGIPVAHLVRLAARRTFRSVRVHVTAGRSFWGGHTLLAMRRQTGAAAAEIAHAPDDLLMIAFTTGSTGPAKGVEFTRAGFAASLRVIEQLHGRPTGFVSLTSVPLFGIFDLLQGAHVVLGPVDPVRVSKADPALLADVVTSFEATDGTASPALLGPLGEYLTRTGTRLPSLVRVISMGAPANLDALAGVRAALGESADVFTTYGATEALPLTTLEWSELEETRKHTAEGAGTCVGRPIPESESAVSENEARIRIITISDDEITTWHDDLVLPQGQIGEIVSTGAQVSTAYHRDRAADARNKIDETRPDGTVRRWHRVGDLAWQDESGRLWFCGRSAQRVRTAAGDLFTVQCEQIFNTHPDVYRTALVGVGAPDAQVPVLCFELRTGVAAAEIPRVQRELWSIAREREITRPIKVFGAHPGFPVDIRHNAKIGREELAEWAGKGMTP